jgi:gluconate kinase
MIDAIVSLNVAHQLGWNVACGPMSSVLFIGGPAGSGKTTLGDAVAAFLGVPHIDFDAATAPVVDEFRTAHPDDSAAEVLSTTRADRYAALRTEIMKTIQTLPSVVVSAPLRQESASQTTWQAWIAPIEAAGARVELIWLHLSAAERRRRMSQRGLPRDTPAIATGPDEMAPPEVADRILDARLPVSELLDEVRSPSGRNFDIF